jgi:DNA-binding transcriptional MocR family regulator
LKTTHGGLCNRAGYRRLQHLAPERTFYFTSFTKCLLPGLRHGYLIAPEAFASAASNRHLVMDWIATPFMAELAARWIEDGTAEELLSWQKTALKRRNALAHELLAGVPFNSSPNGLHIWLPLPDGWGEDSFIEAARQKGIVVAPGSAFALPGASRGPRRADLPGQYGGGPVHFRNAAARCAVSQQTGSGRPSCCRRSKVIKLKLS